MTVSPVSRAGACGEEHGLIVPEALGQPAHEFAGDGHRAAYGIVQCDADPGRLHRDHLGVDAHGIAHRLYLEFIGAGGIDIVEADRGGDIVGGDPAYLGKGGGYGDVDLFEHVGNIAVNRELSRGDVRLGAGFELGRDARYGLFPVGILIHEHVAPKEHRKEQREERKEYLPEKRMLIPARALFARARRGVALGLFGLGREYARDITYQTFACRSSFCACRS